MICLEVFEQLNNSPSDLVSLLSSGDVSPKHGLRRVTLSICVLKECCVNGLIVKFTVIYCLIVSLETVFTEATRLPVVIRNNVSIFYTFLLPVLRRI